MDREMHIADETFRGTTDTYAGIPYEWKSVIFLKLKHNVFEEERRLQSAREVCKSQKHKDSAKITATKEDLQRSSPESQKV